MLNNVQKEFLDAINANNQARVVQLLETYPSLVQIKTNNGLSPVFFALYHGNRQLAATIARSMGQLDVFESASLGELERLKAIVQKNPALVNSYSIDGFTPLALAAYLGQKDTVEYLISTGADVNAQAKNATGFTPLTGAVSQNHNEVAKMLLDNGANVNHQYEEGYTPLIHAATSGNTELVRILLNAKANPNLRTKDGTTALGSANAKGHGEVASILKLHGAG